MMKRFISLMLILTLVLGNFGGYSVLAENKNVSPDFMEWGTAKTVDKDKIWVIKFNSIIDEDSITNKNVYIENEIEETQDIILSLGENNDNIVIHPPKGGMIVAMNILFILGVILLV